MQSFLSSMTVSAVISNILFSFFFSFNSKQMLFAAHVLLDTMSKMLTSSKFYNVGFVEDVVTAFTSFCLKIFLLMKKWALSM